MRRKTLLFFLLISGVVAAQDVKVFNLKSNDVIYLPSTDRLYVSTPEGELHGNSLCVIDPYHGRIETCYAIGGSPGVLAASDDEQYIYIGLTASPEVVRFDVQAQAIGQRFSLGSEGSVYGPNYAEDITVQPGSPLVIAISLMSQLTSPRHTGVAIYDNGVRRPAATPVHTGSNSLAFDTRTGLLYGFNNESSEFGLRKMAVEADGLSVLSVTEGLFYKFADEIEYVDGKLYSRLGQVIDISGDIPVLAGQFDNEYRLINAGMEVAPDSNVVYFLNSTFSPWLALQTFDKNTFSLIDEREFLNLGGLVGDLVSWGGEGKLAFVTKDNLEDNHNHLVILRNCTSTLTEAPSLEQIPGGCIGDTLVFQATAGQGPIFWSNGQVGPTALATTPGELHYQIADEQGCLSPPSNPVYAQFDYQMPAPYIQVPGSLALCQGGQVTLSSTLFPGSFGLQWSNGAAGETIVVTEPGVYSVQSLSLSGCLSEPSEPVTVIALNEPAPPQPAITVFGELVRCDNEPPAQLLAPEGFAGYFWSNNNFVSSILAYESGLYSVQVVDAQGCQSIPSEPVDVTILPSPPTPEIFLSNDNFLYTNISVGTGLQWLLNGEPISDATSQVLEVAETGSYSLQITWEDCSSVSNELFVMVSSNSELTTPEEAVLFPNPATDIAYLRLASAEARAGLIRIISIDGKLLTSQALLAGQEVQELFLSGLPVGLYIVEAFDANAKRVAVGRMVKQ